MCVMTYIPTVAKLQYKNAKTAAENNPDGFGFAIFTPTEIIVKHSMNFEDLWGQWTEIIIKYPSAHGMWHFRIATHGAINLDNCHPFYIGRDKKSILAHNGMLDMPVPLTNPISDSRLFARHILPNIGGIAILDNKQNFAEIENWIKPSKMIIMTKNPIAKYGTYILNETLGEWNNQLWWSNSSYKQNYFNWKSPYTLNEKWYQSNYGKWYHEDTDTTHHSTSLNIDKSSNTTISDQELADYLLQLEDENTELLQRIDELNKINTPDDDI